MEKIVTKRADDPIDRLIFEKNIRIQQFVISKELDLLVLLLTNGTVIKIALKHFPKLKNAGKKELETAHIRGNGIGMRWTLLDEDISLKGLIKEATLNETLNRLQSKDNQELTFL